MDYLTVEEARVASGLRLVLTAGTPAPWSEAAKAIFNFKSIAFQPVLQEPGGENAALIDWTGEGGAPAAVLDDQKPITDSIAILALAERIAPQPALIPSDVALRVETLGIAREIVGRSGLGWSRRLTIMRDIVETGDVPAPLARAAKRHDYDAVEAANAELRVVSILNYLSERLHRQESCGSKFFVGTDVSAVDLYWAVFSIMFSPLEDAICPMTSERRERFANIGSAIDRALDSSLLTHRDFIFDQFIETPLDF